MNNEILILWSAGLDSTAILYEAAKKRENVRIVYIEIKNNLEKTKVEKTQISKILELLNKEFKSFFYVNYPITIDVNSSCEFIGLKQPLIWLTGLFYSLRGFEKEIRIGYCMNDDAISYINEIKKIWKSFQPLYDKPLPKLVFPLITSKKYRHMESLPDNIFQETTFCETPEKLIGDHIVTWEDCGQCGACVRSKNEGIFTRYNRNNKVKETSIQLEFNFNLFLNEPCNEIILSKI